MSPIACTQEETFSISSAKIPLQDLELYPIYLRAFTIFVNKETLTSIFTTSKVIKVSKPKKIEPIDLGNNTKGTLVQERG